MKTLQELRAEKNELMAQIDGATAEQFAELRTKIEKINLQIIEAENAEKADSQRKQEKTDAEMRAARTPNPQSNNDNVVLFETAKESRNDNPMSKTEELRFAKIAFGKQVRGVLQNLPVELSKNEKRALGVAITTTSNTYTAPSADANGVNNGGVFIPQNVLYNLLELDEVDSPFLKDVAPQHIKGAVIFPYVIEAKNGETKGKKENVAADDRSIKWGKLTLAQGNYPLTIEVTMELLAMTDEEFANYLLADLGNEINLLLADEALYGTGTDNRIEGVTKGAKQGTPYAAGKEADAIKAGLLDLSKRARKGAKVYISRSMSLAMAFEKDSDGRYIFPIYNNNGIETIATVPVVVEEGLADGDFVIGNAKNYLLNFIKPTEVYAELHGKTRIIEYTAHLMVAGKAAPNKFYYGKKATTTPTNG